MVVESYPVCSVMYHRCSILLFLFYIVKYYLILKMSTDVCIETQATPRITYFCIVLLHQWFVSD